MKIILVLLLTRFYTRKDSDDIHCLLNKLRAFTIEYLDKLNEYLNNHYNLCIRIEPAPPPPLQRLAMPYSPGFKTFNRWLVILAPDILKKILTYYISETIWVGVFK